MPLRNNILIVSLCMVLTATAAGSQETTPIIIPLETARVHRDWQGKGEFRRVVDAVNGKVALEYVEELQGRGTSIALEIDRVDLSQYSLLRFDWRSIGDDVLARVSVEGYPENGQRNYYLNKNPVKRGDWQRVYLDLALDDDNPFLRKPDVPEGKLRILFRFGLNPVAEASPEPRVVIRLADVKFVRLPVRVKGDLRKISEVTDKDRIGQEYVLNVANRTKQPQKAMLFLDRAGLKHFTVKLSAEQFQLGPGESREITARITTSKEQAAKLAPLYLEEASIFAGVEGEPDSIAPWTWGYMQHRIRGAVPLPERQPPLLLSTDEGEAGRARLAGKATSVASKRLIQAAESALKMDPVPPDMIHGNPNSYRCPKHNAQLRFKGPGRHRCDKGGEFVDEKDMNADTLRAAYFAHHQHLSNTALTLAEAGWESGDKKYLKRSAEILMNYAKKYPNYPITDTSATAFYARVSKGNLQESWWFAPLPRAYDLVRAADIWSEKEEQLVARDLILEGVVLLRAHRSVANQQAEYNRGVGIGALSIGHDVLAAEALDGEYGMRAQWKLDFDGDGWTMERDGGYQRAAIAPFLDFARALDANDVPVFDTEFKKLFDAPVLRSTGLIAGPGGFYEAAYEAYHDPIYQRSIAAAQRKPLPEMPNGFPNSVLRAAGYTILRSGKTDKELITASINWGEPSHRSGRVLFNPYIRWRGLPLNAHVERIAYGSKYSGFSYTAAAGNSLVVNGELQSMARAEQVALLDAPHAAGRWETPANRPQYPGMQWARSMVVCGNTVLVLDQWTSTRPLRIDRFSYLPGDVSSVQTRDGTDPKWVDKTEFSKQGNGYKYFTECRQLAKGAPELITYALPKNNKSGGAGHLQFLGPEAVQAFTMKAPIGWHPRHVPVWALRHNDGTSGWFVSAFTGTKKAATAGKVTVERLPATVGGKELPPEKALALRVGGAAGRFLILTTATTDDHKVAGKVLQGPLAVIEEE